MNKKNKMFYLLIFISMIKIINCESINSFDYKINSKDEPTENHELSLNSDIDKERIITSTTAKHDNDDVTISSLHQDNQINNNHNFSDFIRISELLDVFNIKYIGEKWYEIGNNLNTNCSDDMVKYFNGLRNGDTWAIKMDDATGHYTVGFLFGNNYWTGSHSLCKVIYKTEDDIKYEKSRKMTNAGLSFTADQLKGTNKNMTYKNPTFIPGFYVIKIMLNNFDYIPVNSRIIFIGACLPSTCSPKDVETMAKLAHDSKKEHNGTQVFNVLDVRSPSLNRFNFFEDSTFVILLIVSIVVGILMACGTFYDLILINRLKEKMRLKKESKDLATDSSSGIGCTTYDLTKAGQTKADSLSVGIGMPTGLNNNNSDENLAINSSLNGDVEMEKLSVWSELLLSFSVITNLKAICDRSVGSDTISSIHGLRAYSMAWVILGHTCIVVFKYSDNMELRKVVERDFSFQAVSSAAYSVDTFFFISGFLVSFIYFRTNAKGKLEKLSKGVNEITAGTFHFLGLIGYRFVRLTTPYIFVLGVVEVIMKYYNHNSVFEPPTLDHETCPKYWWRNVLYINTLFPAEQMCMLWSWYLSNDTQFYVIGAIILIVAVRHFKIAAGSVAVFLLSAWTTTAFIAYSNNHMPNSDDPLALFDKIYDKPWTRSGPYLIGMSVGWILFKTNCKIKMSKFVVVIGWTTSTLISLYLVYGLYFSDMNRISSAAYSSLSHSAWALSLAWIIIACSTGYGGYVNKILSASFMYPFSRVTYCAYLVHPIVIRVLALHTDAPLHLGIESMMVYFFGQAVSSYILSFIVSISFEAPVVTMLKILSPNRKKRV